MHAQTCVLLRWIKEIVLYVKTLIKVFPLEFIVKARMFEHVFLGRFQDETDVNVTVRPCQYIVLHKIIHPVIRKQQKY